MYLVCEPPGDPYYLCRIMEFLHAKSDDPTSPIDSIRVNWYYRPRDVQRFNNDSRLLYGTMHSDLCPIASLRGKCSIKHRSEIEDLDAYRKERDSFYFVQVFDRFIRRWYECLPVSQIINVPEKVKKALDERWKFVVVEIGRVKELTSDVKTCKRCAKYCATNDSVECAICKNSYHMNCVQPPLPKKPSRGFAWACAPCSRASERKMEARNTPTVSGDVTEVEEEELAEEEVPSASNDTTRAPSPSGSDMVIDNHPATQAEIALANMWPMRYLGIHCRVEDALQYDDRAIYPRASSRLGPRHQANVTLWPGRPVELVKPAEIKKKYNKTTGPKKDTKLSKETLAALEAEREERAKRPKWVQDEPPGYIARGEDYPENDPRCTSKLMFKSPETSGGPNADTDVDDYLKRAKLLARAIGVPPFGANFLDKALELLTDTNYDQEAALKKLQQVHRIHDLHEPVLSKQDLTKFEEGVAKYGSEHRLIRLHMKTSLPNADIVRFYYLWKKTPKGQEIWGNYGGRKGKRRIDDTGAVLQAALAKDGDDSAFDNDKAVKRNRMFECKFCHTSHSRQWRKAPGVAPGQTVAVDGKNAKDPKDKTKPPLLALCLRCAGLWRKYAIQWEDVEEVAKKVAQGGGRAWKRRIDEELLRELVAAEQMGAAGMDPAGGALPSIENGEPLKKKSKTDAGLPSEMAKKKPAPVPKEPTPPPPPIVPAQPEWRDLPCAVCKGSGDTIACTYCKLTVHRFCFGLEENEGVKMDGGVRWVCEQCTNDRNPQVSTDYACCLCLTEETLTELIEPSRVTHKKKTDREKEKERLEKELADVMRAEYTTKQITLNRPILPREPLKRTTGNNWVHAYCAVWMPEIRFSNAKTLEVAEGFQNIPPAKFEAICKLCKNKDHQNVVRSDKGACVSCFQCHANIHVSCAFEAGYVFGFDVTPVKGSRKDQVTTATLGQETGSLTAGIWCKEHVLKNVVHPVNEIADETGRTAMQVYVENYKQADLTLTGTIRKANLAQLTKDKGQQVPQATINGSRRESTANSIAAAVRRGARTSSVADAKSEAEDAGIQISDVPEGELERRCVRCKIDVTPKWHPVESLPSGKEATPPRSPPRASLSSADISDADRDRLSNAPSAQASRPNAQNIRFMPPGASGRAWDGMPDRYNPRPGPNGEQREQQQPPSQRENSGAITNGQHRSANDGYNHAGSSYQDQGGQAERASTEAANAGEESKQAFLCHKCFLGKKLNPTSPPEEQRASIISPPRPFSGSHRWNGNPALSQPAYDPTQPIRMPWDEPSAPPPPPVQAPPVPGPHPVNGLGLSMGYNPSVPPPPPQPQHPQNYSPYGPQPNGFHAPPMSHQPPPPPPSQPMHERSGSYGYGPPPPPPSQPYFTQQAPPGHSPMQNYPPPPPNQSMSNGLTSPRAPGFQPHLQSPPRSHAPPYQGFGPGRTEMRIVPPQMPPMRGPPQYDGQYMSAQQHHHVHMQPAPHSSQARPESSSGGGSGATPAGMRDGQSGAGAPSQSQPPAGASASPSLRNLLS